MSAQDLHDILANWDADPRSVGLQLRLDLADIIMRHLGLKGWTQKQLAEKAAVPQCHVSRLIHADVNCTFQTAGKVLFALGVKPKLTDAVRLDTHTMTG